LAVLRDEVVAFLAVDRVAVVAFLAVDFVVPAAFLAAVFAVPVAFLAVDLVVAAAFLALALVVPAAFFAVDFVEAVLVVPLARAALTRARLLEAPAADVVSGRPSTASATVSATLAATSFTVFAADAAVAFTASAGPDFCPWFLAAICVPRFSNVLCVSYGATEAGEMEISCSHSRFCVLGDCTVRTSEIPPDLFCGKEMGGVQPRPWRSRRPGVAPVSFPSTKVISPLTRM
jgi:hypothetical protein